MVNQAMNDRGRAGVTAWVIQPPQYLEA
jgi:hypothetical protein